jgi:UDP-2,4-diacetamido-2,4,6-trideoxy-beta-L-altropyranose hydrolase
MADYLRRRSIDVSLLQPPMGARTPTRDADYAAWLGATQLQDAEQTIQALRGVHFDWLIIDHYALGAEWETRLRPYASNVLVFDDLANRPHDCDLLVDQNFSIATQDRYHDLIPANCKSLIGPQFAILRPEYRQQRSNSRYRDGDVRRVLVFFGGSDPLNLTGRAIDALCDPQLRELRVEVVVGVNNPHRRSLEKSVSFRPYTQLHGTQPHLADMMARADLCIGAGGVTTWERMCVGLPSIVVSIAENQRPACNALADEGLILYAGHHDKVEVADLAAEVRRTLARPEELAKISRRNRLLVDGWGAQRVVESMYPTAKDSISLRKANPGDLEQYFVWANDPDVRAQSIQMQPISLENHEKWFAAKLASSDCQLYVMEARGLPVGQIRFDRSGNEERIDYSIDKNFRGRGWAAKLVELGMLQAPSRQDMVFRAEVKESNLRSRTVFSRLGFTASPSEGANGIAVFRFDSSRLIVKGISKCG